jgi:hypothetical protein
MARKSQKDTCAAQARANTIHKLNAKKIGMAITTKDAEYVKRAGKCGIGKPRPIQRCGMPHMQKVHVFAQK